MTRVYRRFAALLTDVELLIGYEGDAFATTGDARTDLLAITAVHPLRASVVDEVLTRDRADRGLVETLVRDHLLLPVGYEGERFYTRPVVTPRRPRERRTSSPGRDRHRHPTSSNREEPIMREPGHVVAVLPSAADLGPVHDALACCGVHADVRAPTPGRYPLEDETLHEEVGAGRRGLVVGFLVAAVIGVVVVTAIPAVREFAPLVRLLLVLGIALQGTLPAILWRMGRVTRLDDDPVTFRDLDADDRLVIVEALHEEPRVRHALERHGAVFLAADEPLARAA